MASHPKKQAIIEKGLAVVMALLLVTQPFAISQASGPPTPEAVSAPDDEGGLNEMTAGKTLNGKDKTPNQLINEKSPYLLQHAYNPVDWYPWGPEAFEKARQEEKPIFLSIGYSTCHWCHVMEAESFEDPQVAGLMNDAFISIKVDREERPDIDGIYMDVALKVTGSGGWPLNVIMTPDQKPFFVGTYIPKESRFGRAGLLELVPRVKELWDNDREKVLESANQVTAAVQQTQSRGAESELDKAVLKLAYDQLSTQFDSDYGGFGRSPKFPSPHNLLFLLRWWYRTGNDAALQIAEETLEAMRRGGIYDHVGFGFHRYSTDAQWLLPHFEKMLYDQAMLAMAYTEAYQAMGKPEYRQTVEEIFTYVLRDMTDSGGGFYSAEDADSEGEEGKFYVWSTGELAEILGKEDSDWVIASFGLAQEGNFREEASGLLTGENIFHLPQPAADIAAAQGLSEEEWQTRWAKVRQTLFDIREQRIHPYKDDKILTDWNGLMIAALAKAARALDQPEYSAAAERAAGFILGKMRDEEGRLLHRYREGEAAIRAHLDDYAFLVWGLLELYETTFDVKYLREAQTLNREMLALFWDEAGGGLYFTAEDGEKLLTRQKDIYDGAIPSGNSVAMLNLLRLGRITAEAGLEEAAARIGQTFSGAVQAVPMGYTQFLQAVDFGMGPSYEIVIAGQPGAEDTETMLRALQEQFIPNKVVLFRPPGDSPDIAELAEFTRYQYAIDNQATAYVCRNYFCEQPTTDVRKMLKTLVRP